jgi:hypothetical protein
MTIIKNITVQSHGEDLQAGASDELFMIGL